MGRTPSQSSFEDRSEDSANALYRSHLRDEGRINPNSDRSYVRFLDRLQLPDNTRVDTSIENVSDSEYGKPCDGVGSAWQSPADPPPDPPNSCASELTSTRQAPSNGVPRR